MPAAPKAHQAPLRSGRAALLGALLIGLCVLVWFGRDFLRDSYSADSYSADSGAPGGPAQAGTLSADRGTPPEGGAESAQHPGPQRSAHRIDLRVLDAISKNGIGGAQILQFDEGDQVLATAVTDTDSRLRNPVDFALAGWAAGAPGRRGAGAPGYQYQAVESTSAKHGSNTLLVKPTRAGELHLFAAPGGAKVELRDASGRPLPFLAMQRYGKTHWKAVVPFGVYSLIVNGRSRPAKVDRKTVSIRWKDPSRRSPASL